MKKIFQFALVAVVLCLYACGSSTRNQNELSSEGVLDDSIRISLSESWATDSTQLITPECASYDAEKNVFYVSNLNRDNDVDDDGYMSIVNADGTIKNANWVEGVEAPLGNDFFDGHLYVNDKTTIVKIDIETGKIVKKIAIEGAKRLNGIDVDENGDIYSADIDGNKIFKVSQAGEVSIDIENEMLDRPNGVIIDNGAMIIASSNGGKLLSVALGSKEIKVLGEGIERADGIVPLGEGQYLVSSWTGLIHFVGNDSKSQQILDTKEKGMNAADITYIPQERMLIIPTFNDNRLVAYKLDID